jgi:hypothetical protein
MVRTLSVTISPSEVENETTIALSVDIVVVIDPVSVVVMVSKLVSVVGFVDVVSVWLEQLHSISGSNNILSACVTIETS